MEPKATKSQVKPKNVDNRKRLMRLLKKEPKIKESVVELMYSNGVVNAMKKSKIEESVVIDGYEYLMNPDAMKKSKIEESVVELRYSNGVVNAMKKANNNNITPKEIDTSIVQERYPRDNFTAPLNLIKGMLTRMKQIMSTKKPKCTDNLDTEKCPSPHNTIQKIPNTNKSNIRIKQTKTQTPPNTKNKNVNKLLDNGTPMNWDYNTYQPTMKKTPSKIDQKFIRLIKENMNFKEPEQRKPYLPTHKYLFKK